MPSWQQDARCFVKLTARACAPAPSFAQSSPVRITASSWRNPRVLMSRDPSARSHSAHPVKAAVATAMTTPHRLLEPFSPSRRSAGPAATSILGKKKNKITHTICASTQTLIGFIFSFRFIDS
jgi:hypothetical protein